MLTAKIVGSSSPVVTSKRSVYSRKKVPSNLLKISGQTIATILRMTICAVGVAMLISFPTARTHGFGQHFGTIQIRQNIVRHTFVAGPETGAIEEIAQVDAHPVTPVPPTILRLASRLSRLLNIPNVATFRIVRHVKLGPTRSGASDPLL
jgi:hypothetical protein